MQNLVSLSLQSIKNAADAIWQTKQIFWINYVASAVSLIK
jgi:hypothetical protein